MALGIPMAHDGAKPGLMPAHTNQASAHVPVAIIGGGLAGCAAASILAQAGWKPLIIERDTFPRGKLCGEFLSGESGRMLEKIGCLPELLSHNPPVITQGKFISTSGKTLTVALPSPAYGISRRLLDDTLFRHASSLGANGMTDTEVRDMKHRDDDGRRLLQIVRDSSSANPVISTVSADLTIAAYGRHTRLDHNVKRPFVNKLQSATGFKLHHRIVPGDAGQQALRELAHTTEIYGLHGGYCGVGLVEGGLVNVCMLLQKSALGRVDSNNWTDIAAFLRRENKALAARLDTLVPAAGERVLSVSRMTFHMKDQAAEDDLVFAGDAAGMIAPLCGDGQAMALESGVILGEMLFKQFPQESDLTANAVARTGLAATWQRTWRSRFARRMRLGNMLQHALYRPTAADMAMALLRRSPHQVTSYLARATRTS
jgi:flavin-dependent dehydrogenase